MHICFIGEFPYQQRPVGGVGTFMYTMGLALQQAGCRVSILSFSAELQGWHQEGPFEVYRVNPHPWPIASFWHIARQLGKALHDLHQRQPIDVVEAAEAGLFLLPKLSGTKYVVRLHGGHVFFSKLATGTPYHWRKAWIEKKSIARADGIVGVSQYVYAQTCRYFSGMAQKPHAIIANPVDTIRLVPNTTGGVTDQLIFYGALAEKKGIRQLLQAMPLVQAERPQASLHIYGRDTTMRPHGTSYKSMLQQWVAQHEVPNISFFDPLPQAELAIRIQEAQAVVLPSHMEAMPLAWLEAMALGKPLIAGHTGPAEEIIHHGHNGWLCQPHDPKDIAKQILNVLSHPQEAAMAAAQARTDVETSYGATALALKNLQFYQRLCAKP